MSQDIKEFKGEYSWLSNFESVLLQEDMIFYPSVENAYQAAKTNVFNEKQKLSQVSAGQAKRMGREITIRPDWDKVKIAVMKDLVKKKFSYSPELRLKLINTAGHIQEGNYWNDRFWGVDLKTGEGENNLGKIIMQTRDALKSQNKIYAGIGAREAPDVVLVRCREIAAKLAEKGYVLRSGGAAGCDSAFEDGADSVNGKKEIYLPWNKFNGKDGIVLKKGKLHELTKKIAQQYLKVVGIFPRSYTIESLFIRNVFQLFGEDFFMASDFVVCYTKNGKAIGGTGVALKVAEYFGIPIYNLYYEEHYQILLKKIGEM